MSSDEEDYMSDSFLLKCADTRPGLAPKNAKEKFKQEQRQKEADAKSKTIPRHKLEAVRREEGLGASIAPSSKGFALLQKMGYKPGMGIGKEGKGRIEPVGIELKNGRSGLGRDSELKRKSEEMNQMRAAMLVKRSRAEETLRQSFKGRVSERWTEKSALRDLKKAQRACLQLDSQNGVSNPDRQFFWPMDALPDRLQPIVDEDDEDDEETRKARDIKQRLRLADRHDDSDLDDDADDDDHDEGLDEENDDDGEAQFSDTEKLDILTRYLRNVYHFCIWCGTKYDDESDLVAHCPGNSSDAHD